MPVSLNKLFYILIIFSLFFSCTKEESVNENIIKGERVTNISFENIAINSIASDGNGSMWMGTDIGLYRFMQNNWYFYNINTHILKVSSMNITNNHLTIGTYSGAFEFSIVDNNLVSEMSYNRNLNGISSDSILAVGYDKNNNLWLGSMFGINQQFEGIWKKNQDIYKKLQTASAKISAMAFTNNNYYFSSLNKALYHVTTDSETDAITGASQMIHKYNGELTSDTVYCVISSINHGIWFGTNRGLTYNKGNSKVPNPNHPNPETDGVFEYYLSGYSVFSIFESKEEILYVGTDNGLYVKNGNDWTNYTISNGLVDNSIISIALDLDGSIWLGTLNGISQLKSNAFTNY